MLGVVCLGFVFVIMVIILIGKGAGIGWLLGLAIRCCRRCWLFEVVTCLFGVLCKGRW